MLHAAFIEMPPCRAAERLAELDLSTIRQLPGLPILPTLPYERFSALRELILWEAAPAALPTGLTRLNLWNFEGEPPECLRGATALLSLAASGPSVDGLLKCLPPSLKRLQLVEADLREVDLTSVLSGLRCLQRLQFESLLLVRCSLLTAHFQSNTLAALAMSCCR